MKRQLILHRDDRYLIMLWEDPEQGVLVQLGRIVPNSNGIGNQVHAVESESINIGAVPGLKNDDFKKRVAEAVKSIRERMVKRRERNEWIDGVFADYQGQAVPGVTIENVQGLQSNGRPLPLHPSGPGVPGPVIS
jgi:hypothetical protein